MHNLMTLNIVKQLYIITTIKVTVIYNISQHFLVTLFICLVVKTLKYKIYPLNKF
jgi:hypothetical protein